jgi:hypothetical protein
MVKIKSAATSHMNTLRLFTAKDFSIPASTSWYLADLGEFRGKQTLYTQQSPQRLKTLREHALIESAATKELKGSASQYF